MALAGFSLQEVTTDLDLPQPSPLPLRESYPRCVRAGDLLPALCPVPLALVVPLAILIIPGWALLLEGTSSTTCGELRMLLLRGDMELCDIGTALILLLGFLFLSHCPTHDPSLPPMNSSSTKVFIKTFAIVHTNYISNSSSGQDFDAQNLSNRLKERAFLLHKSVGIVSPAQQSVFPLQSTMD